MPLKINKEEAINVLNPNNFRVTMKYTDCTAINAKFDIAPTSIIPIKTGLDKSS